MSKELKELITRPNDTRSLIIITGKVVLVMIVVLFVLSIILKTGSKFMKSFKEFSNTLDG